MSESEGKIVSRSKEMASKWMTQAEEAMAAADTTSLRALVKELCDHNQELASGFETIISLYASKGQQPLPREPDSAIGAMRDVALAAIELSKASFQSRE